MMQQRDLKLSICISTFNRSSFIGETLESIIPQLTSNCEIVVSDNASNDDTERVVGEYAHRCDRLRYVRHDTNEGIDRNYDRAVGLTRGEYCWLFSDDDLIKPGAVSTVLKALERDVSLIVVNVEVRNADVSRVLRSRWNELDSDRLYGRNEMDSLFSDLNELLWYIGNIIIKRAIWITRDRERGYGFQFPHVAIIYQMPLPGDALVVATPLVIYRVGNTHAWGTAGEALLVKWPSLVETLAVSRSAKRKVKSAEPWKSPQQLLRLRGGGSYSMTEYRRWVSPRLKSVREKVIPILVALLPGTLVNVSFFIFWVFRRDRGNWLIWMSRCPYNPWPTLAASYFPERHSPRN